MKIFKKIKKTDPCYLNRGQQIAKLNHKIHQWKQYNQNIGHLQWENWKENSSSKAKK